MSKPAIFLLLCLNATLIAALFGAVHNQVSFTIGASYFYDLKFAQFGIDPSLQGRLGAALVGVMASWWMGLAMGLPAFILAAILLPANGKMFSTGMTALGIAVLIVIFCSGLGLLYGFVIDANLLLSRLPFIHAFSDPLGFARAGMMHDASYLGGILGGCAALVTVWKARPSSKGNFHET